MLMQKHSPNNNNNNNNNNKIAENEDVNSNSSHSNGNFFANRNASVAGSECNDDKSIDACSSGADDDELHDQQQQQEEDSNNNAASGEQQQQENNHTAFIDSSNREQYKLSGRKKKKKTVKVKFSGSQDDKAGIKLKIRRTNNFNQDENHVIVDGADEQIRKRHLKAKRNKQDCQEMLVGTGGIIGGLTGGGYRGKCQQQQSEEASNTVLSDDSLPHKRSRADSEEELLPKSLSIGINTASKGTEIDETILGPCQAGSKLTLESVVLMETKSGILIVSVQWRGKTLMGALMESERFQIGTLEKDSIYRREKFMGMNRRNTRRKSKNLFGKKKRKTATPLDPNDVGGTENEAGNSDVDNPYICDKENCHMKFSDFQALRIHIYQSHRNKDNSCVKDESSVKIESTVVIKSEPTSIGNVYLSPDNPYNPLFKSLRLTDCKPNDLLRSEPPLQIAAVRNRPSPQPEVISANHQSEERNSFSPAYSDISDANEAPVLENEAELKLPSAASQPPLNLSLCHTPSIHAANRLFSPTAPALQPEGLCSGPPLSNLRLTHDTKLSHLTASYGNRYQESSLFTNGYLQLSSSAASNNNNNNFKPQNGVHSVHSSSGPPQQPPPPPPSSHSDNGVNHNSINAIQDLSMNNPLNLFTNKTNNNNPSSTHNPTTASVTSLKYSIHNHSNNHHKTAPTNNCINNNNNNNKPPIHQSRYHSLHSSSHGASHHHTAAGVAAAPPSSHLHHSHPSHPHSTSNGYLPSSNPNSKYSNVVSSSSSFSDNNNHHNIINSSNSISSNQLPLNGVVTHLPYMSFATPVNSPPPKFNPSLPLYHQQKY